MLSPGFGDDLASRTEHIVNNGTLDVGSVNVKLAELEPLMPDVLGYRAGSLFFRAICRRDRAGDDHGPVEVTRNVLLVAIKALRSTLSTMAHLGIFHRDATVRCNPLANPRGSVVGRFQVLLANLCNRIQVGAKR